LTAYPKGSIITITTTTGTEMKTNKEKNLAHDAKMAERMRPKQPEYNFKPLEDAIRAMILNSKVNE
jgi:hypothetical protein